MEHSQPLRFFVSSAWQQKELPHIPLLFPFWGNATTPKMPFMQELFATYSFDTQYYEVTDVPDRADAVLIPYSYALVMRSLPGFFEVCKQEAKRLNLPLVVDGSGDIDWQINDKEVIVLRQGGYRFSKRVNDIEIPFYAEDLLQKYHEGALTIQHKSEVPSVGFAGWASLTPTQRLRIFTKELPNQIGALFNTRLLAKRKGILLRQKAIRILQKSPLVHTNLLVRRSYSAHVHTMEKGPQDMQREFVSNVLESDYALDIRGDANNSIRLFEILSLGRIPVIIDTQRNLPFVEKLDYTSFALVVDFRKLRQLPQIIVDFNAKLSDEQFVEMQKKAREAYLTFFRIDHMTKPLMDEIQAKILNLSS